MVTNKNKTTTKTPARAKSAAAKKTVKKPRVSRRSESTRSRSITKKAKNQSAVTLPVATAAKAFWVCNGEVLHTAADLASVLQSMDDNTFAYHVSKEKNDFATWVEEVLGEEECAATLRRAQTKRSCRAAVLKCLRNYNL